MRIINLYLILLLAFLYLGEINGQIAPSPVDFACDQVIYTESFEAGVPQGWMDLGIDQYKTGTSFNEGWVIDRDTTFTAGTGPNGAEEGDFYAYCDGSGPIGRGETASMLSPPIEIPDAYVPALTFYLNMHGRAGSFEVNIVPNGESPISILPAVSADIPGGLHDAGEWEQIYVSLDAYKNQSVQLEFVTTKPSGVNEGDIAIDHISICTSVEPVTVPAMGQWGVMILFMICIILGVVAISNGSFTPVERAE